MFEQTEASHAGLAALYGDSFYDAQMEGSLLSARRYVQVLAEAYTPLSVVDVGCGRGMWLDAFREHGARRLVGLDGPWNGQENMVDSSIVFMGVDLNNPEAPSLQGRFDLAMSVEVAEHLRPESAEGFVRFLVDLSDMVMFGAAFTEQGGINHINEQPHSFWANLFGAHGYVPFDLFRPVLWGASDVEFWYQQNTFVYVRRDSRAADALLTAGQAPIRNLAFMDCVHPRLYELKLKQLGLRSSLRRVVSSLVPEPLRRLVRRLRVDNRGS